MELLHAWNRIPSFNSTGITDDALWRQLLSSGTGETPAQHAGHSFQEPQWVHINGSGIPTTIEIDRHFLVRTLRLRYRDLAAIDPTLPLPAPSVILVRARAIALNLDVGGAIRIIICENQVYVLSVPKASDPALTSLPTETHPFVKRLCCCLKTSVASTSTKSFGKFPETDSDFFGEQVGNNNKFTSKNNLINADDNNGSGGGGTSLMKNQQELRGQQQQHLHHHNHQGFDPDMPYELRALEVALAAALGILTAEIDALEEWGYPAVDGLLRQVDRDSLELVRKLKNGIDKLQAKVHRLVTEIGDLMEDDDDMADLYLGRRAEAQGLLPLPQPGEVRDFIDDEIEKAPKSSGVMVFTPKEEDEDNENGGGGGGGGGGEEFFLNADDKPGIDHDDDFEQEVLVREAEEALADRQRARHDRQTRHRKYNRESGNGNGGGHHNNGNGEGDIQDQRRYRLRNVRDRGGNTPTGTGTGRRQRGRNYISGTNTNEDNDDVVSIGDSLSYSSTSDLQDEALSRAEEAFLLRQSSLDNGGGGGGGGSSTFGGAGGFASRVDPHEIEEAEDLLETMFERSDMLLRRLSLLDERCVDTEALLELDLDQKRNQLVGLNVVVSSMSMSFGFAAAIGGIFGMNLKNEDLATQGWVLALVLTLMLLGSLLLILVVAWYMKHKKLMFIPTAV